MSDLADEARRRHEAHAGQASHRPLSEGYEDVGLSGEDLFAREFGLAIDMRDLPGGDGGIDFVVPLWVPIPPSAPMAPRPFTVDVKAARIPKHLLVEQGKVRAQIYVLARFAPAELLGWEWGSVVRRAPLGDKGGFGVISHYIARRDLRPMSELKERYQP